MTNATAETLKENVDAIFAELPESEATELVLAALEQKDDPRSAHDLAVEFGATEPAVRGIQHFSARKTYSRRHDYLIVNGDRVIEFRRDFDVGPEFGEHYSVTDCSLCFPWTPEELGWVRCELTDEQLRLLNEHHHW